MQTSTVFKVSGQHFQVLPDKALFWEEQSAILVADTHFGKAATFRNRGIPVPTGTTDIMLDRLTALLQETSANHIYFLGDFVHSHTRHEVDFESELLHWRNKHSNTSMTLIMGNHDRGQRTLFDTLGLTVVDEPLVIGPIGLCHYPETKVDADVYKLAGHIHPAINLSIAGDRTGKLPCFHFSKSVGVLPAFGEFTGTALVKPALEDSVFVVADGRVIDVSLNRTPH